jgi:hypothetical protein
MNNETVLIMALCLKYGVLTLYDPGNILFQIMLINSDGILVQNTLDPLLYFESGALTSQLYASSAVFQLNKEIKEIWRYDAL